MNQCLWQLSLFCNKSRNLPPVVLCNVCLVNTDKEVNHAANAYQQRKGKLWKGDGLNVVRLQRSN